MKKELFFLFTVILSIYVLLAASTPALAQIHYYSPPPYYYQNAAVPVSVINQDIKYRALDKLDELNSENQKSKKTPSEAQPRQDQSTSLSPRSGVKSSSQASLDNNPLPYKRDRLLSSKIREDFLADYARQVPDEVAAMRLTAERTDFVQLIAAYAQLQGLDSSTMEGLMAYWYGQSWAIAHRKPLPTAQQFQGIAKQLRSSNSQTGKWSKMNNAERQTFFEQIAHPLFLQRARYQSYQQEGKSEALARMANATQNGFKKIGLDMQSLRLSNNGFIGL